MVPPLVVLDTMVVVRGIIGRSDSPDVRVLDAMQRGELRLAISDAQLRELRRVMYKPDVESRISIPGRAFELGLDIGVMGLLKYPRRLHWPNLGDSADSWILDLALEARVDYIVTRDEGVSRDAPKSGFLVLDPPTLVRSAGL